MSATTQTARWLTWAVIEVQSGRRTLGEVARRLRTGGEQSRSVRAYHALTAADIDAQIAAARARRLGRERAA